MKKTILLISDNLPDQINGVVTTFKNLTRVAQLDDHEIVSIDPSHFPHRDCPGYPEVKLSWPRRMGQMIQAAAPDHIHIATEGPLGLAARLWCDWHGYHYNTSYHTKFPEFLHKIYRVPTGLTYAYLRWFHKHSGRVLATTDTMVQELRSHGFQGELVAWSRGVDRNIFHAGLRGTTVAGRPILVCVSRISREKGLDDFCQLDWPGATKLLVGDGPYLDELKQKYSDQVIFVGAKTGPELGSYYANADVFVFPSRNDTFGVVNIEAIACGTPVAAYPVPGPIDIIEPGINGAMHEDLITACQACLALSRDQVLSSADKWTWERCWQIFKQNLVPL